MCGTAFALIENIGFTSAGSADWISSVAARTTTALPHIFNSGLLGWALVSAWHEHRYGRLLATFLAVILVHGTSAAADELAAQFDDFGQIKVIPFDFAVIDALKAGVKTTAQMDHHSLRVAG